MKNNTVYINDILESITKIEKYIKNINEDVFLKNDQIQDAVLRRLEIIGEATKQISNEFKEKYPVIPWKKVAGLRDILIHTYSSVNLKRIWKILDDDLIELKKNLLNIQTKQDD